MVHAFLSFNIAVILLLAGKAATTRSQLLRRYSIPEPVLGGVVCMIAVAIFYVASGQALSFDLEVRDFLLLLFFAGIGFKADVRSLIHGGRPLAILLAIATAFMIAQNILGMTVAGLFGLDPRAGLMVGSISLTGGVGTTVAWTPIFVAELGIENAMELGIASNMLGLIAACVVGGPIAARLVRRHGLTSAQGGELDVGAVHDAAPAVNYYGLLKAMLLLNVAVMLGMGIHALIGMTGLMLPAFVSSLFAGILLRNAGLPLLGSSARRDEDGVVKALALISDIALGLFLTMALMGLHLWDLSTTLPFILTAMTLQIAMAVVAALLVVFYVMGRDYEAAVVASGFGGIVLGSTATAIANMTAVTQQHGAAHRAFVIVPLVCGFFIDIVNAMVISAFISVG